MFIVNPESISNTIEVNRKIGHKLICEYKIPVLSRKNSKYIFCKTDEIIKIINQLKEENHIG